MTLAHNGVGETMDRCHEEKHMTYDGGYKAMNRIGMDDNGFTGRGGALRSEATFNITFLS